MYKVYNQQKKMLLKAMRTHDHKNSAKANK